MHRRRRQQVVLRPNQGRLVEELKDKVREHFKSVKGKEKSQAEKKIQRAEQLFLLATNPAAPEGKSLPAVPSTTTNDPWAEPGWYLNLSVPKVQRSTRSILPKNAEFTVFQQNFCEIATAPGRQAASFLRTTHLRPLTSPLSCVAQAISLAETTPMSSRNEVELTDSDPLNITDAMMKVGYTFYVRAPTKSTSQTKRKSSTKEESEVTVKKDGSSEDSSSKSRSSSSKGAGSNSTTSTSTGNANTPPPQARRTSSKGEKSRRRATKSDPSPKGKAAIPKSTAQSQSQSQHSQVQPPKPQSQPQPQPQTYMQQQQGGPMGMRGVYGQGQAGQLEAQYGQQYMKPAVSATQASPARLQQLQVQPQQIQQALPPQQQLLPQRQQFPSSQQFQQQLRMMQQQAGARQVYPQGHPGHQMQFFNPAMAQRQPSFTSQQPLTIPVARGVAPPVLGVAPRQPQLRSSQQNGDDQNDPLFMLS
mmetsp:Transcript_35951/g.50937  ORF Transcript_35951/g.50937 Transcript_35951/m.50937 type:complete len:474 (-) Transcript_35951:291-1712(-)